MENKPLNQQEEENIRFDNELEKLRLIAEEGASFFYGDELPPELEREFLSQIRRYEEASRDSRMAPVGELVGFPDLRPVSDLSDAELPDALDQVIGLLRSHGIFVESIKGIPAREMYRFITEDLLPHEMQDMRIEGMNWHFIYEEFFPEKE